MTTSPDVRTLGHVDTVAAAVDDYCNGDISIERAAERIQPLLVPHKRLRPARGVHELWHREAMGISNAHSVPHTPDSWDDVAEAHRRGRLSDADFEQLIKLVRIPEPVRIEPPESVERHDE